MTDWTLEQLETPGGGGQQQQHYWYWRQQLLAEEDPVDNTHYSVQQWGNLDNAF